MIHRSFHRRLAAGFGGSVLCIDMDYAILEPGGRGTSDRCHPDVDLAARVEGGREPGQQRLEISAAAIAAEVAQRVEGRFLDAR